MKYLIKCVICGETQWARGWEEPDVNAGGVLDSEPLDQGCDHVKNGGDYEIIDSTYDFNEEDVI